MKSGISSLLKFAVGSALGVSIGAAIGALMAPKSGEETQADTFAFIDQVKTEGELARQQAEEQLAERYRQTVNDPTAFSSEA